MLLRLMSQLQIQGMARFINLAARDGLGDSAAGLGRVMAVGKAALAKMRRKLPKGALQHAFGQVMQTEFLKAW